jgi:acetyl-CoA carboxylase carboxyltransferase component
VGGGLSLGLMPDVPQPPSTSTSPEPSLTERRATVRTGGAPKYHAAAAAKAKLFARERVRLLVDEGSFVEDGLLANALADGLPADGVITGLATVDGRPVCVMANDSTVKAGSWGARTVEKIIRIIERAYATGVPMVYLVDSAGARITDQVDLFPGRRGAGRIFHTQVRASGAIPQVCALFGPSAAGGAYIPAFCDLVVMVEGNASMYLGSDRMVEMVTGEKTTLEAMGGARVHCAESGVGHLLVQDEVTALDSVRRFLALLPSSWTGTAPRAEPRAPEDIDLAALIPASERQVFDMRRFVRGLLDEGSFFEIHTLWARELVVGLGRLDGDVVGIVANNPLFKGGVLFVDSADKATRFVQLCDAFNIPLVFLADVPGFMVGTVVEKQGIIRHGAKMISAVSEATVPKVCVVVRKAYGAGLYAMCGPAFDPDATLALPSARIAVMGAEAAVNAVYANAIAALPEEERAGFVAAKRTEYDVDVDLYRLASELVVDAVVEADELRAELVARLRAAATKDRSFSRRRHGITPV